jgi:hypothetical protein
MVINWDELLEGKYISIVNGVPKKITVTNWRVQDKFKDDNGELKAGVTCDVLKEDGKECVGEDMKEWTVTSIKACKKLKDILIRADMSGRKEVTIQIVRIGEGKKTQYEILEVAA